MSNQFDNKLYGVYRGKVLKHLPHGRCKIFIPGVYSEDCLDNPNAIPSAEQASPIFAGANNGNGMFSYPNIGSTVLCLFMNGDQNYPVYFATTLGGQNAFGQFELVMPPRHSEVSALSDVADLDVRSERHLVTAGKAQLEFYESGRISAYVSDPIRTAADVKYSNSYEFEQIDDHVSSRPVCQMIDNQEISSINCQGVMDVQKLYGDITFSTHHYDNYVSSVDSVSGDGMEKEQVDVASALTCDTRRTQNNGSSIEDSIVSSLAFSVKRSYRNLSSLEDIYEKTSVSRHAQNSVRSDVDLCNGISKSDAFELDYSRNFINLSTQAFENELSSYVAEACSWNNFLRDGSLENAGKTAADSSWSLNAARVYPNLAPRLQSSINVRSRRVSDHVNNVENSAGVTVSACETNEYTGKIAETEFQQSGAGSSVIKQVISSDDGNSAVSVCDILNKDGNMNQSVGRQYAYTRDIARFLDMNSAIDCAQLHKENSSQSSYSIFDQHKRADYGVMDSHQLTDEITSYTASPSLVRSPGQEIAANKTYKVENRRAESKSSTEDGVYHGVDVAAELTSGVYQYSGGAVQSYTVKEEETRNKGVVQADTGGSAKFGTSNVSVQKFIVGPPDDTMYEKNDHFNMVEMGDDVFQQTTRYKLLTKKNNSVQQDLENAVCFRQTAKKTAEFNVIASIIDKKSNVNKKVEFQNSAKECKSEIKCQDAANNVIGDFKIDCGKGKIVISIAGQKNCSVTLDTNGKIEINAPGDLFINANTHITGTLDITEDVTCQADVKASNCGLNTHTHNYITPTHAAGSAATSTGT